MSENMMNTDHIATNEKSRSGYETIFSKPGVFDMCISCDKNPRYGGDCKEPCQEIYGE